MKPLQIVLLCAAVAAAGGCSQSAAPPVAVAYANQYGPAESSRFTPCPKFQGVWQLSHLSGGSLLQEKGDLVPHLRWFGPKLFDLTVGTKAFIAIDEQGLETVLYLSDRIPGPDGKSLLSYTAKPEKELPCLGHGWREAGVSDHSLNDAAARVLHLIPEKPKKITQTDYFAKTAGNELLLASHIEFQGTHVKMEPVNSGYWHFLKMPRLHEIPKDQGYRY